MVTAMKKAGIPALVSNTAGTYVCNHIMYQVLYMIDHEVPQEARRFRARAVHPPTGRRQAGQTSPRHRGLATALGAGLAAIVECQDKPDERSAGGAIHQSARPEESGVGWCFTRSG